KSCFVRKNAVHFLTLTIKENPFGLCSKVYITAQADSCKKLYDRYSEKLQQIQDRQFERIDEVMKLSDDQNETDSTNTSIDSNKENEGGPESSSETNKNKRKSGEPLVDAIAAKKQKMAADIEAMA